MLKARHLRHPVKAARGAQQLLRFHLNAIRQARTGHRTYRRDPRWNLNCVEQGFRPRIDSISPDTELLRRICRAYEAASRVSLPEEYRPTEWWEALRRSSLHPVISALQKRDLEALQRMYANFFRDRCSDGLVGKTPLLITPVRQSFTRMHRAAYLSEALSQLDAWRMLTGQKHDVHELAGPGVGNPFGIIVDDVLVPAGAAHQHYYAHRIADILCGGPAVVAEIGGGYGAMAYYLLRDRPDTAYLNFDLPESLALAAYYLIKSFPHKRIRLYGETSTEEIGNKDFDIALLPLTELSVIPARFVELTFSSHVLCDLRSEALDFYLRRVRDVTRRSFLYEGMHQAGQAQDAIRGEFRGFLLKEEKQFSFSRNNSNSAQLELLYERTHPAD